MAAAEPAAEAAGMRPLEPPAEQNTGPPARGPLNTDRRARRAHTKPKNNEQQTA